MTWKRERCINCGGENFKVDKSRDTKAINVKCIECGIEQLTSF